MRRKATGIAVAALALGILVCLVVLSKKQKIYFSHSTVYGWLIDIPEAQKRSEVASVLQNGLNAWISDYQDLALLEIIEMGDEGTIALGQALKHGGQRARESAAWVLHRRDRLAVLVLPELIGALTDDSETVRSRIAGILGDMGPEAKPALGSLRVLLKNPSVHVRLSAAKALNQIGKETEGIPILWEGIKNSDDYVRSHAASSLAKIGQYDDQLEKCLLALLSHEQLREDALEAFGNIGKRSQAGIEALIGGLKDRWNCRCLSVSVRSLISLGLAQEEVKDALLWALKCESHEYRRWAAETIGNMRSSGKEFVLDLEKALDDPEDSFVRKNAAEALRKIQGSQ